MSPSALALCALVCVCTTAAYNILPELCLCGIWVWVCGWGSASCLTFNVPPQVEEFVLWPLERVVQVMSEGTEFKTNVNMVIIDFMVRHGFITPEQPGYLDLVKLLRSGDCT